MAALQLDQRVGPLLPGTKGEAEGAMSLGALGVNLQGLATGIDGAGGRRPKLT